MIALSTSFSCELWYDLLMRRITIKEGPVVFLKDLLAMEIFAVVVLFAASFVENYEMLYKGLSFDHYLRYEIFILVASFLFQFLYFTALFLNWYFSYCEIGEREVVKKSGIFFRRRKSVSLADIVSVETYQSPLDRLMRHATIILEHKSGRLTKIRNVSGYAEYLHIIKRTVEELGGQALSIDGKALIELGEGAKVEFKETLRYDIRKKMVNKDLEKVIIKSIVGFLNADGGIIFIGVTDEGVPTGLTDDYATLPKKNRDGFENHLTMLIKTMIGLPFAKHISIEFQEISDKEVCVIGVGRGHKPAYLQNGDRKEEFFVRVGNSTQPFMMSEAEEHIKTRFG